MQEVAAQSVGSGSVLAVGDVVAERSTLFASLDADGIAALRSAMTVQELQRGDVLFSAGTRSTAVFVIASGRVALSRTTSDGSSTILALLGPGDLVGELALFDDVPHTAAATALGEVTVWRMDHDEARHWLAAHPDTLWAVARYVAQRVRRGNAVLTARGADDVTTRVAGFVLELARRFGTPSQLGIEVAHDLTQDEMAQLVGAKRETVSRVLADFAAREWIAPQVRSMLVLDADALSARAAGADPS